MQVTVNIQGQIEVAQALGLLPANIKYAVSDTIRSVSSKYRTNVSRGISSQYQIKAAGFSKFRTSRNFNRITVQAKIFTGFNSIKAHYLKGKPRKVPGGAEINGVFFPRAFIAKMPNGASLILRRDRAGERTGKTAPAWVRNNPRFRLNLPIDEQRRNLPAAAGIIEKYFNALPAEISRVADIQLKRQLKKMRII